MDFASPNDGSHWYACRTRARAEKAVHGRLDRTAFRSYLPVLTKKRRWADRTKAVGLPLFPGYVFVQFPWYKVSDVLATSGLVEVVKVGATPSPIREDELRSVHALVTGTGETGSLPTPADYLEVGDSVVVTKGPFTGMTGLLMEERGRTRVVVKLPAIRQAVAVELRREWLTAQTVQP